MKTSQTLATMIALIFTAVSVTAQGVLNGRIPEPPARIIQTTKASSMPLSSGSVSTSDLNFIRSRVTTRTETTSPSSRAYQKSLPTPAVSSTATPSGVIAAKSAAATTTWQRPEQPRPAYQPPTVRPSYQPAQSTVRRYDRDGQTCNERQDRGERHDRRDRCEKRKGPNPLVILGAVILADILIGDKGKSYPPPPPQPTYQPEPTYRPSDDRYDRYDRPYEEGGPGIYRSRDEALANFKARYEASFYNKFTVEPVMRPSWIPYRMIWCGWSVTIVYHEKRQCYGFWYPRNPDYFMKYEIRNTWENIELTDRLMWEYGYRWYRR